VGNAPRGSIENTARRKGALPTRSSFKAGPRGQNCAPLCPIVSAVPGNFAHPTRWILYKLNCLSVSTGFDNLLVCKELTMTLQMNNSITLQRTVDDLQRRLALLESMIKVTGRDMSIRAPGNLTIQAGANLELRCGGNRGDRVGNSYTLDVSSSYTVSTWSNLSFSAVGNGAFQYGSQDVLVGGNSNATIGGNNTISAGRIQSLTAGDMILANRPLTIRST
jgi:hypothetical protein